MKNLCKSIFFLLLSLSLVTISTAQERDVEVKKQEESIYKYVDSFINATPRNVDSLIAAVNYAIAFGKDSVVKAQIAGYLFNKFSTSQIMGDESIAVYISKNYFLNGLLPWFGDGGVALLRLYTEFNENSLLGMRAPELYLSTPEGRPLPLTSLNKKYTIIYFFDKDCSACKEGLAELKKIVKDYGHLSLAIYAVYTAGDSSGLNEFKNKNFNKEELENWHFVYDPLAESNFHKLYNVIITPRLFLLNRDKKIIGRNLSNNTLKEMLTQEQSTTSQEYTLAEEFVQQYLSIFDLKNSTERKEAFEPLFNRLSKENLNMYNAVFYQLFEHLAAQEEQYLKTTALFLAENYILPYKELWFNSWFVQTRVPKVTEKIKSNSVGAKVPSPTLFTPKGKKTSLTQKKSKYIYLYFFNTECAICKPFSHEIKKIFKQLKREKTRVIAIYTGTDLQKLKEYIKEERPPWSVLFQGANPQTPLYEYFEISYLPQTYLLNRDGIIIAKGINTIQLKELIK